VDGAKIPYVYGMACPRCGEKTEMYYTPYCPKCDIQKMLKHQHGSYNLIPILHYGESYVKGFDHDLIWDYFGDRGLRNDSYIDWAYDTKDLADKWTSITTREVADMLKSVLDILGIKGYDNPEGILFWISW